MKWCFTKYVREMAQSNEYASIIGPQITVEVKKDQTYLIVL